jgi:hypothetical protein
MTPDEILKKHLTAPIANFDRKQILAAMEEYPAAVASPIECSGGSLIEKAIDDTFNQVHYSHLHPDVVAPIEQNTWRERWIKENIVPLPVESQWISVWDDLPKGDDNDISCLCYDKHHSQIRVLSFNVHHHCWDDESGDDYYTEATHGNVSHWQPLPPKPNK